MNTSINSSNSPQEKLKTLEEKAKQVASEHEKDIQRLRQQLENAKTIVKNKIEEAKSSEIYQKVSEAAKNVASSAVDSVKTFAATPTGKKLAGAIKTAKETAEFVAKDPHVRAVTDLVKKTVDSKLSQAETFVRNEYNEFQTLDDEGIKNKGRAIFAKLADSYQEATVFKSVINKRAQNLKRRLRTALVSEVEGAVVEMYSIHKAHHPTLGKIDPELLIPALLASVSLSLSQAYNWVWIIFNLPIYIAYVLILFINPGRPCYIDEDGTTLQSLFVNKAIIETVVIVTTVSLFIQARRLQREYPLTDGDTDDSDNDNEEELGSKSDDNETIGEMIEQELSRAHKAVALLESLDLYCSSKSKTTRDFFGTIL